MGTTTTTTAAAAAAQVSTGQLGSTLFRRNINRAPNLTWKGKQQQQQCFGIRCALYPPGPPRERRRESRRLVSVSLVLLQFLSPPKHAIAGSGFDKYMKRKKLEPLEVYVPAIILTQLQIEDLGKTLEVDQPQYAACRNLLHSGPAASLRVNIRAVAQYASDSGNDKIASTTVDQCLSALEELDSLLLRASRHDPQASVKSMKSKIGSAVGALDSLLKTVPSDVLNKGRAIADAYRNPEEEEYVAPERMDPGLKQLESIL